MRLFIISACVAGLAGCASSGPVPIGKDTFMITKQSAGGVFVSGSAVKVDVLKEAYAYCTLQGKVFQLVHTNERDAIPAQRMPFAEVEFMCLKEGDPAIIRPKLRRDPDMIIERR